MIRWVPELHGARPTELVVLSAIGVKKGANNFLARCVRPIGLTSELRHEVTSFN